MYIEVQGVSVLLSFAPHHPYVAYYGTVATDKPDEPAAL